MTIKIGKSIELTNQEMSTLDSFWTVSLYVTQQENEIFLAEVVGDAVLCEADPDWQDENGEWHYPSLIDGKAVIRVEDDYDGTKVVICEQSDSVEFKGIEDDTFWGWIAQTDFYDECHVSDIRNGWRKAFEITGGSE